ncbi:MAG: hypothetical protein JKY03_03305 [Aureispira sp.]|nr:hypothetical protein [Aureispira sp.]
MTTDGFANLIIFLFFIAVVVGFVYLIYRIVLFSRKKLTEQFKKIGDKYGLELEAGDIKYYKQQKNPVLKGNIRGHDFVCSTYCVGYDEKTKIEWTEFTLQHNLNVEGYNLRLVGENIFRKMGKGLGAIEEIEIGVQDFDKRFLIDSENLSTTRSLLNRNVREKLLTIPTNTYFGELLISANEICYKIPKPLYYNDSGIHFETALDTSILLLEELKRVYR